MPAPSKGVLSLLVTAAVLAGCTGADGPGATSDPAPPEAHAAASTAPAAAFPIALQDVAVVPGEADLGETVTARAVVKNVGAAPATAHVEFRLGGQVASAGFATLGPGESTIVAGPVRPGRTGNLTLEARVVESGETLRSALLVHGPDLVDAWVSVIDLQQCDRVAHRVSFRNAGDGAALGVTVESQLRSPDGAIVDRLVQGIGDLRPGASTLVEFTHVAPARCPTQHTYTVRVVATAQSGVAMEHDSAPFTV
ncbi:MAG TPA: hypothetical protein VNX21_00530 [Candidatus Thermoplasmatota archaeon]|nr:hypothetical protein [Candidatus Thermoplasmatota archaeon]